MLKPSPEFMFDGTWYQKEIQFLCEIPFLPVCLQSTTSNIRLQVKQNINLVIADGHINLPWEFVSM